VEQSVKGLRKAEGAAQPGEANPVLVATHVSCAEGEKNSMRVALEVCARALRERGK
jgi:hypothetical protein